MNSAPLWKIIRKTLNVKLLFKRREPFRLHVSHLSYLEMRNWLYMMNTMSWSHHSERYGNLKQWFCGIFFVDFGLWWQRNRQRIATVFKTCCFAFPFYYMYFTLNDLGVHLNLFLVFCYADNADDFACWCQQIIITDAWVWTIFFFIHCYNRSSSRNIQSSNASFLCLFVSHVCLK